MSSNNEPVVYEVTVCEIAFNGERGAPQASYFRGPKAKARALGFAEQEWAERGHASITSVTVLRMRRGQPDNRSRAFQLWQRRNPDPVCPCNDPRCTSRWAAGKIRDERWYVSSLAVYTGKAVTRHTHACEALRGCSGDASWAVEGPRRHGAGRRCVAEPTRYLKPRSRAA